MRHARSPGPKRPTVRLRWRLSGPFRLESDLPVVPRDRLVKERVLDLPVDPEPAPAALVKRVDGTGSF